MPPYPPLKPKQLEKLKLELSLVPRRHREDALQEAWVAFLEGRNPIGAAKWYAQREGKHESREMAFSQID